MSINLLNEKLFLAINAANVQPAPPLYELAVFCASWLVSGTILLFIILWVRADDERRAELITATFIMLAGLGINQLIGFFYFHPRPFMVGLGHQLVSHLANNSFPSDHGTFMWSLGLSLLFLRRLRIWGAVIVVAGFGVAWGRIYVGIHWPFDMAASLGVALFVALFTHALFVPARRWILPPGNALYEWLIVGLHLPPMLFPRRSLKPTE